jgi:exonuclease SbcC
LRSEQEWRERLLKTGFAVEAQYLAACLPEEERVLLGKQAQTLQAEQIGLTGKMQKSLLPCMPKSSRMLTNETL